MMYQTSNHIINVRIKLNNFFLSLYFYLNFSLLCYELLYKQLHEYVWNTFIYILTDEKVYTFKVYTYFVGYSLNKTLCFFFIVIDALNF